MPPANFAPFRTFGILSDTSAITDHTQGLTVANGLDERRLSEQGREIATLNRTLRAQKIDFTILRSAEMNLSPTGEGDLKPAALAQLDVVLGCFHSSLQRTDDQTSRYVAGLRNPNIQILGHPQTRMYNRCPGLKADWPRVFAEAARLDKAVEIDSYADRQDLRLSLLKIARAEGARIQLGTDAHPRFPGANCELLTVPGFARLGSEGVIGLTDLRLANRQVSSEPILSKLPRAFLLHQRLSANVRVLFQPARMHWLDHRLRHRHGGARNGSARMQRAGLTSFLQQTYALEIQRSNSR